MGSRKTIKNLCSFLLSTELSHGGVSIFLAIRQENCFLKVGEVVKTQNFCILLIRNNVHEMFSIGLISLIVFGVVLFGIAAGVAISAHKEEK